MKGPGFWKEREANPAAKLTLAVNSLLKLFSEALTAAKNGLESRNSAINKK